MNSPRFVTLSRLIMAAGFVVASAAAQAGGNNNVYWSVNVDAPLQGAGRVSTSFSNTRGGYGYGPAPVYYAPAPIVIQQAVPVYDDRPGWGRRHHRHHDHHHARHHGHRHGERIVSRVASKVHRDMARMHGNLADFHGARAERWEGGRRDWYSRDDRRGGYYDY